MGGKVNYQRCYDELMTRARNRVLLGYQEQHHVIPRCMGGTDEGSNLVSLTPEEHYVAHQLLVKMHPENRPLVSALLMMSVSSKKNKVRNNKVYGWVRRKFSASVSGENNPSAKLTAEQVIEIYHSTEKTADVAKKYNVGCGQVTSIKRKMSYKKPLAEITEPPGVHPSCRRVPLSKETIIAIFLDTATPTEFKQKYNVGVSVVRRIKNRQTYRSVTKNLQGPGQIIIHKLSPEDVFTIRNSKEKTEPLAKKYGVHKETIRNIKSARTRRFVEFFD